MSFRDQISARRHARFVGRTPELSHVQGLLDADAPSALVWVHGPGGVGKTSLLREIQHVSRSRAVPVGLVDLQALAPSPVTVAAALDAALAAADGAGTRRVLLIDTAEAAASLDDWFRETWLPEAPDNLLMVVASRHAPGTAWTADPGWSALLQPLALGTLSDDESRALLAERGVDADRHGEALAFARGHPLALALVADAIERDPTATFQPLAEPDTVGALVQRFLSRSASAELREALEACAVVRCATEPILAELLERAVPSDLFDELANLPIVEGDADGLVLHSLARDVVLADLRWRAPERDAHLHARARRAYTARLHAAATPDAHRHVLADYAFLYRDAPVAGPLLAQLQRVMGRGLHLDAARPADHDVIVETVRGHEGDAAARIAAHWLDLQPDGAAVVRDADDAVLGLLVRVRLDHTTASERAVDPLAVAAHGALREMAPRDGEAVLLFRFWMDREAHQAVSTVQALLFAQTVWDYLATPRLALSMLACARPHLWAPVLAFAGLHLWPEASAEVGGTGYDVFGHDWRAEPPGAWLDALAGRAPGEAPPPPETQTLVVLARDDFDAAVRDALRVVSRPGQLLGNPLLGSRLVRDRLAAAGDDPDDERAQTDALAALIGDAVADVAAGRRGEDHAAAIRVAFLRPAPSQEIAAERLGVPYSTFRRHLARGIDGVAEALWLRENGLGIPSRDALNGDTPHSG